MESILKNYEILQSPLEEIEIGNYENAAKGRGVASMQKFDTFPTLILAYLIFFQQLNSFLSTT